MLINCFLMSRAQFYEPHLFIAAPHAHTMAVVLDREGRAPTPNPANLPRVTVKNVPVLSPEHLHKGLVTGRTQTVYTCNEPDRQTLWKENYDR